MIKTHLNPPGTSSRRAYKLNEAAAILGISGTSLRRLIKRGEIKPCRVLRHVLVPVTEIDRLLGR